MFGAVSFKSHVLSLSVFVVPENSRIDTTSFHFTIRFRLHLGGLCPGGLCPGGLCPGGFGVSLNTEVTPSPWLTAAWQARL